MKDRRMSRGVLLATAAMLLITSKSYPSTLSTPDPTSNKPIRCYGINNCRGRGQCGSKTYNACAGQNSCKGRGWIYLMPDVCLKKGGKKIDY